MNNVFMTEEEVQRHLAEQAEALAKRPVKSRHAQATIGSKTERGGEVATASTDLYVTVNDQDLRFARVGDWVYYPDGSKSQITSGAGLGAVYDGKPMALVGSHIENGDTITSSLQDIAEIVVYADEDPSPGFLVPGYVPPQAEAAIHRKVGP